MRMMSSGAFAASVLGGAAFSPLSLGPEIYAVFAPPDLFQATGGSTPTTADSQTVGSVLNRGTDGGFFEQAGAAKPVYHTADGLHWIEGEAASLLHLVKSYVVTGFDLYVAAAFMPKTAASFERLVSLSAGGEDHNNPESAAPIIRNNLNADWGGYTNGGLRASVSLTEDTAYVVESIFSEGEHVFSVNGVDAAPVASNHDFDTTLLGLLRQASSGDGGSNARIFALFMRRGAAPTPEDRALLRTSLGLTAGLTL